MTENMYGGRPAGRKNGWSLLGTTHAVWDWFDVREGEEWWSPRFYQLLGYSEGEIDPNLSAWRAHLHPDDREAAEEAVREAFAGRREFDVIYRLRTKTGDYRWFRARAGVFRDSDGSPRRMTGTITDITEERAARGLLARHSLVLDQVSDPVIALDASGKVLTWNQAAEELFERPSVEAVGGVWDDSKWSLRWSQLLEWIGDEDSVSKEAVPLKLASGAELVVRLRISRYNDPEAHESGFVVSLHDETADLAVQEEKRKLAAKVQQAQKLESLGVLAGGIAHDFNNLLVAMVGNAELALLEIPRESPVRRYVADIGETAQQAADLANQMLAYSGRGRFIVEELNISRVIREMQSLLSASISKKVILRYELAEQAPPVMADVVQLRQVIMNLVANASDAIDGRDGQVTIRTGVVDADREYLESAFLDESLPEGEYVFLEVGDTGNGMSVETQKRIFDPFFTTKFTGRGLGLAAVLGIVRGHKGAIRVYSQLERGSTFKLLFPCSRSSRAAEPPKDNRIVDWTTSGRILVADDEERVLVLVERVLKRAGLEAVLAVDGEEAVRLFRTSPRAYRAVLLDLTMPRMDGEEAFNELSRISPQTPLLMMSGYHESEVLPRFAGKKIAGFLQKPFRPQELLGQLRVALGEDPGTTPTEPAVVMRRGQAG